MVLQIAQSISVYGSYFAAVIGVISNDLILGVLSLFQKQPQRQKKCSQQERERDDFFFVYKESSTLNSSDQEILVCNVKLKCLQQKRVQALRP